MNVGNNYIIFDITNIKYFFLQNHSYEVLHEYTLPGLSLQLCLSGIKEEISLITDINMVRTHLNNLKIN